MFLNHFDASFVDVFQLLDNNSELLHDDFAVIISTLQLR